LYYKLRDTYEKLIDEKLKEMKNEDKLLNLLNQFEALLIKR